MNTPLDNMQETIDKLLLENERLRNGCKMGEQAILAALPHADRIRDILFPMLADVRAAIAG